ncbi:MAG: M48 family metallopeptidase [Parvularculaceae bacterium]
MGAYGLQTHIWNNNLKSVVLLAGFPVLLLVLTFGVTLGYVALFEPYGSAREGVDVALERMREIWVWALVGAAIWFALAYSLNTTIVRKAVGAKGLTRKEAPDVYNLVENLCISRGERTPRINVIETPQMNAFASGVDEPSYTVTLTRGLMDALDRDELEAVIAHELTHIRNRDVRLLIVATVFVGIFSFVGELLYNGLFRSGLRMGGHTRSRRGDSRGGGMLIIVAIAAIAVAYALALVIRFALSRKREYLADAGAAELTRNPDAMIRALEKISGRSELSAPDDVRQMMLDNPVRFIGVFATHPPIDKRIEALRAFG